MDMVDIGVMETILKIEEVDNYNDTWYRYGGYKITTDKQEILLLIDTEQDCCENAGYFMSEDIFDIYIGAQLRQINITDTALNKSLYDEHLPHGVYDGDVMFVDLVTNSGVLQFTAYNEHNGYYGHKALVVSNQLRYDTVL